MVDEVNIDYESHITHRNAISTIERFKYKSLWAKIPIIA